MKLQAVWAGLALGDAARIEDIQGDDELVGRLMEMGLTPDTVIKLVGMAPFGDPLEFEVRGYHLSLRRSEADRLVIAPLA
jgi:ferrous iron transport protein A